MMLTKSIYALLMTAVVFSNGVADASIEATETNVKINDDNYHISEKHSSYNEGDKTVKTYQRRGVDAVGAQVGVPPGLSAGTGAGGFSSAGATGASRKLGADADTNAGRNPFDARHSVRASAHAVGAQVGVQIGASARVDMKEGVVGSNTGGGNGINLSTETGAGDGV